MINNPHISAGSIVSYASSLTLANQVTSKPRHTKYSSSTAIPGSGSLVTPANQPVTPAPTDVSYYRVRDSKGITCILLKTDALIEVSRTFFYFNSILNCQREIYLTSKVKKLGKIINNYSKIVFQVNFKSHIGEEQGDTYIPEKATVEGSCTDEDEATMRILWPGYSLQFDFAKVNHPTFVN